MQEKLPRFKKESRKQKQKNKQTIQHGMCKKNSPRKNKASMGCGMCKMSVKLLGHYYYCPRLTRKSTVERDRGATMTS